MALINIASIVPLAHKMVIRHGYQPIRPPQKQCTQEEMWATLAKHTKAEVRVHVSNETQSPKEKSAPLEWQKPVRTGEMSGYVLTTCLKYSVSKDCVGGKPMYLAWKCRFDASGKRELPTHLGIRLSLIEAQHLCELENQGK